MNRKHLVILLFVAVVVVLVVVLGIYFGTKEKNDDGITITPSEPATTYQTPSDLEYSRIDCYPEEKWSTYGEITQSLCESRGCIYDPFNGDPENYVPSCYVNISEGYTGTKDVNEDNRYILQRDSTATTQHHFSRVAFQVYYPSENVVRIKVGVFERSSNCNLYDISVYLNCRLNLFQPPQFNDVFLRKNKKYSN